MPRKEGCSAVAQLLDQGVSLGDEIATLTEDTRAQAAFARKAFCGPAGTTS